MISEKTLYALVHSGLLSARTLDCPRIIRFKPRRGHKALKIDTQCRQGRTIQDFKAYMKNHPELTHIEMDTLEGEKGGKVLLTLTHPPTGLVLAFLRERNDAASVTFHMNKLKRILGFKNYGQLFPVILTDNGSEFSNPTAIEESPSSNNLTISSKVFYCDPARPDQKPFIENSHTLLRRIFPKGTSFNHFNQAQIDLALSHINSYALKKLNDQSPFDAFNFLFGPQWLIKFNLVKIPHHEINLTPSLLK